MTAETAEMARPVRTPGVRQRMVRYWIVLATVRHILQDRRFQETVIVGAIGVVALAQVGQDNQAPRCGARPRGTRGTASATNWPACVRPWSRARNSRAATAEPARAGAGQAHRK